MRIAWSIARRFNKSKYLPRSLVVMRLTAIAGIAIGTATLIVALCIVSGFGREYRKAILDFNAHIVVLKAGEIDDTSEVLNYLSKLRPDEKPPAYGWLAPAADLLKITYHAAVNFHNDVSYKFEDNPAFLDLWEKLNPDNFKKYLPGFIENLYLSEKRGVIGVTPFIYREGLAISKGIIKGVVVKGVDPGTIKDVNQMQIAASEPLMPSDKKLNVVLGKALSENMGSPQKINLLIPEMIKGRQFVPASVIGTFESGLYDYDSQFALMNIEDARRIFETGKVKATGIEIKLDDPKKAETIADELNTGLPASYQAITWGELNRDIFEALSLEKLVFTIIMGILVIVAAFNIIGVLVLLICYRAHEVAILKAQGVETKVLIKIFTLGGVSTGLWGTLAGVLLGVGASWAVKHYNLIRLAPEVYFLKTLPIDISWAICGIIALFSVLMCWGTSRIAAKKLALLPISENL